MITGTLKSKIDKLWLELWASATLPRRDTGRYLAVIAYYLRHQEEIEAYLDAREQRVEEVRQRIERHQEDLSDLRRRLRARHHGS
jgi:hypothetical protein